MIKINLLKPEKKEVVSGGGTTVGVIDESKERKLNMPALIGAIAITIGTIGLLYFLQTSSLSSERKLLEERTLRKAELEKVLQKLAELEATKLELDRKIKIINDLKFKQKDAVFMMDKLSRCLPDWVWLTDLNFKGGALALSGKALSNNLIADLINNLQTSNFFINVKLKSSTRNKEIGIDIFIFKVECVFVRQPEANKVV
ncbi:MAG: PilN domain-containing protein [Candidatus Aminicenantes bacterium]|nr:PilN domain-containing protein [Candidatus Aminicenantes bacterium]